MSELFVRGDTHENIWDDSAIVKTYDESMKLAKEVVAKRLAAATNNQTHSKTSKKKAVVNGEMSCSSSSASHDKDITFKVGDFCRSKYEVDGVDYEARIISIDPDTKHCCIKYVGYNNEETVEPSVLLPSWGKKHRKLQKIAAQAEKEGNIRKTVHSAIPAPPFGIKSDVNLLIPPPPPMPPMMDDGDVDSEYLAAMLMSWYMSGYYTGLYQGRKEAAKRQN